MFWVQVIMSQNPQMVVQLGEPYRRLLLDQLPHLDLLMQFLSFQMKLVGLVVQVELFDKQQMLVFLLPRLQP
jgi:hypothetical protein